MHSHITVNLTEERVIGGSTRTYQWDSLNRLIAIQSDKIPVPGSWRTEFAYDGQSRRMGIVEKIREDSGWTTESSARYLWEGTEIIQKRDLTGSTVTAKYFDQGEIRIFGSTTIPSYFTRDQLGSVREVVNQGGVIAQSFDYTPWGERTSSTAGSLEWGLTGHHYHEKSGLCLAMFRAYDANLGRWLSEDPIGEAGGLNLYGYVNSSPILNVDQLGLWTFGLGAQGTLGLGLGVGLSAGLHVGKDPCLPWNKGWSFGGTFTAGGGVLVGGAATAGGFAQVTGAPSVSSLAGWGADVGVSANATALGIPGSVGVDWSPGLGNEAKGACPERDLKWDGPQNHPFSYQGGALTWGGGPGTPLEGHAFLTHTWAPSVGYKP